jgi:hypothetical protein
MVVVFGGQLCQHCEAMHGATDTGEFYFNPWGMENKFHGSSQLFTVSTWMPSIRVN